MSTARTEKAPQPSNDNIRWVIPENQMSALDLSIPTLVENRRLSVAVDGKEVAVGILALPPREPPLSAFWTKIKKKLIYLSTQARSFLQNN